MDNNIMKTIKHLKDNKIELAGVTYRPYFIGDLPNNFGCLDYDGNDGVHEWFGYKGFCYIKDKR